MQLHDLLEDDDAVSPVIGVILMVAITVILAAVIGTFVLGLTDSAASNTPTASFDVSWDSSASPSNTELYQGGSGNADDGVTGGELTVGHTSGDTIEASQLSVTDDDGGTIEPFSGDVTAGDSVTFAAGADDTVRVVWESDDGETTDTLAEWEGPEA